MNIKVIYHSSTGNTAKLANAIAEALNVTAEPLGEEPLAFSAPVDLLFIGDGVYFGKANKRTIAFINRLSPDVVKNAAVFATYGGQNKIGMDIVKLLRDKGIKVISEPFTCKGQAWALINRKRPDENDLKAACEYAKAAITEAGL